MNNGGLTKIDKGGMGHTGVHQQRYNSIVAKRRSPSPGHKDAPTFYYQSDGSGRDSYILMDNGGLRPEYDKYNKRQEVVFVNSLRNNQKSPIKYFKEPGDQAEITTYLNWQSKNAKWNAKKNGAKVNDVTHRLTTCSKSPRRMEGDNFETGPPSRIMTDFVNSIENQNDLYNMITQKKLMTMQNKNHNRTFAQNKSTGGVKIKKDLVQSQTPIKITNDLVDIQNQNYSL